MGERINNVRFRWGSKVVGIEVLEGVIWKEREWRLNDGVFEVKIILKGFQLLVLTWSRVGLDDQRN